jgi:hypothetical protein
VKLTHFDVRFPAPKVMKSLPHRGLKGASELFDAPQVPGPLPLREGQEGRQIFKFTTGSHNIKVQNLIHSSFNAYSHHTRGSVLISKFG